MKIENWKITYDKDLDTFYAHRLPLPRSSRLFLPNGTVSYYVTKNGKIVGIMIEYFLTEINQMLKTIKNIK